MSLTSSLFEVINKIIYIHSLKNIGDNNMYKKMILILAIVCLAVFAGCSKTKVLDGPSADFGDAQQQCKSLSGKWLENSKECEGISEKDCSSLGGKFNECASACRNDSKAQVCTMQCVIVCQLNK